MREVATEEEAFAEMRRFLEVNNIPSDVTSVSFFEERQIGGKQIPPHKTVLMQQCGFIPPKIKSYPNPCFGIYYSPHKPLIETVGTFEENGFAIKRDCFGEVVYDEESGYPVLVSDLYKEGNTWYTPLMIYLKDLANRKAGDSKCR